MAISAVNWRILGEPHDLHGIDLTHHQPYLEGHYVTFSPANLVFDELKGYCPTGQSRCDIRHYRGSAATVLWLLSLHKS